MDATTPYRFDPVFRAGRTTRRVVRRMSFGHSAGEVARMLKLDAKELDAITANPDFPELLEAYRRLRDKSRAEAMAELERVAHLVLEELVEERDPKVCAWFFREMRHGRDPCVTLASSVMAAQERAERAAQREALPPPPPKPPRLYLPRPYDDLEALRHRVTARLRDAVVAENAMIRRAAPAEATPPPPPRPLAPLPPSRAEIEAERALRRVTAKLMGRRVRERDPDTS